MRRGIPIILAVILWVAPTLADPLVDTLWVRRYDGLGNGRDQCGAMAVDAYGNVCVTGYSLGPPPLDGRAGFDYATLKYDASGNQLWARRYNGSGNSDDYPYAMDVDALGNIYVTGMSIGSGTAGDYATVKYAPDGTVGWVRRYDGPANGWDCARGVAVDDSGNLYVTGMRMGSGTGCDYATVKYYSSGTELWVRGYNGPGDDWDYALAVAVDDSGSVCVTGYSVGYSTRIDCATIKYHPNGDTAWLRRYNGPGSGDDYARSIVVDASGNVYVTGNSWDNETASDYVTIKYRANGELAWVATYDGPANDCDYANAVEIDTFGNVYVTGYSRGIGTDFDYATVKYDSSGNELWVRRENGPGNWDDGANGVAVDGWGNVYVTGMSLGSGTWFDYATVGYDSSGTELWSERSNGPGNLADYARAIVADGSGNVYVTGYSHGTAGSYDYHTIKYHQCEGNHPPDVFSLLLPPNKASVPRTVRFEWETAPDADMFDQITYDLYVSRSKCFDADSTVVDSHLVEIECVKTLDYGMHYWKVKAKDKCGGESWCDQIRRVSVTEGVPLSIGDVNSSGTIDLGDVVYCLNFLYRSGPAPAHLETGDCNCDHVIDVGDAVYLINYLFRGGPPPEC